jgi:hypothetical protein
MKLPLSLILAAAGVPVGIALADLGNLPSVEDTGAAAGELVADGERLVNGVGQARAQLEKALEEARAGQDMLLATCLAANLEELSGLESKAVLQFRALRDAATADTARVPFVVLTVMGQKANLIADEAAQCVGADETNPGISAADIEPPVDPNAGVGEPPVEPALPPGGELPVDVPRVPPAASPVR